MHINFDYIIENIPIKRSVFYIFFLVSILILSTSIKANSVNNLFLRKISNEISAFDKIKNPNSLDSLHYLRTLANVSHNYCDSTTVKHHEDIISRICDVYPVLKKYPSISDDVDTELLAGIVNIYFAEEMPFNNNIEVLQKLFNVAFNIICNIYSQIERNDQTFCIEFIACSYIDNRIRDRIIEQWKRKIDALNSQSDYVETSTFLYDLFGYLSSNGEYENTILLEEMLCTKCQTFFSDSSNYYYDCIQYLSVSYFNANNYQKAIELQKRILEWNEANQVPDKALKNELRNLCYGLFKMGHYKEASKYGKRLIDCTDNKTSIEYINDYSALAYCIFYSGEEELAIEMLKGNIEQESALSPKTLARSYGNISALLRLNNDMVNSIRYAEMALSHTNADSKDYDEQMTKYSLLINLGAAYHNLNDIQSSLVVLKKAELIYEELVKLRKFDKDRTEEDILLWTVLARDFIIIRNTKGAESAIGKALDLARDYYGEFNVKYLKIYATLADLYLIKDDGHKALDIYNYVLKHIDSESRLYYSYLSGYSDYCVCIGHYNEAMEAIKKAFSRTKSIKDLIKLTRLEFLLEQYESMRKNLHTIFYKNRELVNKSFLKYNEIQRKSFWCDPYVGEWFQMDLPVFTLASNSTDSLSLRILYDATIFSKGILLSTESDISELILNSNNPELICKYDRFLKLDKKSNDSDEFIDYSLLAEDSQLESELMQYVREHCHSISALNVSSKDIQKKMSKKSIAIEFISADVDTTDTRNYYALVLEPDEKCGPKIIQLFSKKQLDSVNPDKYYTSKYLTDLIWTPLREYIQKYDTIYFAPCDILNNIAIEHLPDLEGGGYMSDNHVIYRFSNTRELVLSHNKVGKYGVGLFGGMIYNTDFTNKDESQKSTQNYIDAIRGGHSYLPNSKIEVEKIDSIMKSFNICSYIYTGLDGTEENLKKMCQQESPYILHIATHGMYYSKEDIDDTPDCSKLSFMKRSSHNNIYTEDLALTQSVLLFTGADGTNKSDNSPIAYNDGNLTAQEIASLNLNNTDLVVLSACQSGLGEIKADGVFGLQRGFKKAGVNSLLMSLWDVDDNATQLLMVTFYQNLLSGKSKQESLHLAQKTLRQSGYYNDPYYWAGFILLDGLN